MSEDYRFFKSLVMEISSSLELSESWKATYDFLATEFPLVGITLHRYDQRLKSMCLDFLVTGMGFFALDTLIPMTDEDVNIIDDHERCNLITHEPSYTANSVATKHNRAIADYLPPGEGSYMIAILSAGNEVVGHLCFIGSGINCFTNEHLHKIELARAPISLAMVNMLQHKKTKELQQRLDEQRQQLEGEVELLKDSIIIGREGGLRDTMEMVGQLAGKEAPVLILGETGTGKELIADAVQRISSRKNGPYVKVNCGAIPETLMDSELFGYQKGAFTGAVTNKAGRFEQAEGGTLFLDEVGELSPQAQVRLLRVLQNGIVERVGGTQSIPVDVRILAATNRNLENMLQNGSFREDLFFRLNVFPINLPPLRDRKEDIPLLAYNFLKEFSKRLKLSHEINLDVKSIPTLQKYSWPGNVRELKNLVERALTLNPDDPVDLAQYLPQDQGWYLSGRDKDSYLKNLIRQQLKEVIKEGGNLAAMTQDKKHNPPAADPLMPLDAVVADHISKVLEECRGKINGPGGAAEVLQINPSTLRKRMSKLGIQFRHRARQCRTEPDTKE